MAAVAILAEESAVKLVNYVARKFHLESVG